MNKLNAQRALVSLLGEICAEQRVRFKSFSDDWIFCLRHGGRTEYVFGYDFGINSATAKLIAKDKSATSDLLAFHGIPCVEHQIFHSPQLADYVPLTGNWPRMIAYFDKHKEIVCKPNEGTGGMGVFRVRTLLELEKAVLQLFRQHRSICFSPFEQIAAEYRVAVLRGKCEFVYRKERSKIKGDGKSTVQELLADWLRVTPDFPAAIRLIAESGMTQAELEARLKQGKTQEVNWRHNLGQGASPVLLKQSACKEVCALAVRGAKSLGIELASVDVVEAKGKLKILEVNSGIMMESLARISPDFRDLAKMFYTKIICALFGIKPKRTE